MAIAFLLPDSDRMFRVRSWLLAIFLVSVYTNAPVLLFGWTLAVMGMAQCRKGKGGRGWYIGFAGVLLWLMLYALPIAQYTHQWTGLRLPLAH